MFYAFFAGMFMAVAGIVVAHNLLAAIDYVCNFLFGDCTVVPAVEGNNDSSSGGSRYTVSTVSGRDLNADAVFLVLRLDRRELGNALERAELEAAVSFCRALRTHSADGALLWRCRQIEKVILKIDPTVFDRKNEQCQCQTAFQED